MTLGLGLAVLAGCLDPSLGDHESELTKVEPEKEETRKPRMQVCDRDFVVTDGKRSRALLYCATGDLQPQGTAPPQLYPGYRRLVITQHGRGGNARMYFETTENLAVGYEPTFIVAPQLLRMSEVLKDYSAAVGFIPGWHFEWGLEWPLGSESLSAGADDFTRTSYELLDQLIETAVARLPDLREVVIVGQSAGGQLVNRYAASSPLVFPAGVRVRYIPMNPQSWLYLSGDRPYPELAWEEPPGDIQVDPHLIDLDAACPGYNDYHTGLDDLASWPYFVKRGIKASTIISQFKTRWVINMVGEKDTGDPEDGDWICEYKVQGVNRNLRAKAYQAHVVKFYTPLAVNHALFEIPNVSHGHKAMYESKCGRRWIFDDHNAPCL